MKLNQILGGMIMPVTLIVISGCATDSNHPSLLETVVAVGSEFQRGMANEAGARLASGGSPARYQQIVSEQQQRDLFARQEAQDNSSAQRHLAPDPKVLKRLAERRQQEEASLSIQPYRTNDVQTSNMSSGRVSDPRANPSQQAEEKKMGMPQSATETVLSHDPDKLFYERLNLTEEQKPKICELLAEQRQRHRELRPNPVIFSTLSRDEIRLRMKDTMAKHKLIDDDIRNRMREIMTPEQFALYANTPNSAPQNGDR